MAHMMYVTVAAVGLPVKYINSTVTTAQQEGWLPPTKRASAAKIN